MLSAIFINQNKIVGDHFTKVGDIRVEEKLTDLCNLKCSRLSILNQETFRL